MDSGVQGDVSVRSETELEDSPVHDNVISRSDDVMEIPPAQTSEPIAEYDQEIDVEGHESYEGDDEDDGETQADDLLTIATYGSNRQAESTPVEESPDSAFSSSFGRRQRYNLHSPEKSEEASLSTKRKQSKSPDNASKKSRDSQGSDEEADCCPICFEQWTNSGKHKLISLKCGHLFGMNCIERWIKEAKKCPQCNATAKSSDIRPLFTKRLKAIDNSLVTNATKLYESEREIRKQKDMELAKMTMKYQMALTEINQLKSELEDMKNSHVVSTLPQPLQSELASSSTESQKFFLKKSFTVSSAGNCRVMDFHAGSLSLAISQPSPHTNFMSGYGLKKFSLVDMKSSQFNILHTKPIKDVRFSPHSSMVLSASQDEFLKITSWETHCNIHTYKLERPVWCCCWDLIDSNLLYAGLSNGLIHCYDLRYTADVLHTIANPLSKCPIVAMYNIPRQASPDIPGGLLVQTFEGVTFWQQKSDSSSAEYTPYMLPLHQGNCAGLQYSAGLNQCLVSYRPGRNCRRTTHVLCQLSFSDEESFGVTSNSIETYQGGSSHKLLTRNAIFSTQSTGSIICFGDEEKNTVNIYEAKPKGKMLQALPSSSPALDILPITINETSYITALTDKHLKIFEQK